MTRQPSSRPAVELRIGGLHLTIQRIPGWLLTTATASGGLVAAWFTQR